MSAEVRDATRADVDVLSKTLASAFADDPVFGFLLPTSVRNRPQRLRRFFATAVRSHLRGGRPLHVAGDGQGAAIWEPPGARPPSPSSQLRDALPMAAVFRGGLLRAGQLQAQMLGVHPKSPKHWYLYIIGTHVDSQGRGLGSAMLHEVLDRADAAGESAYLESSNIRNVPLYERHGFTVVEEIRVLGDGPPMWRMWRDPA
jgi:ribosomal protein S18 acetylase RimI-like enzyme